MIRPGSVKICSLREVQHAQYVIEAEADLFGLIFVPGAKRRVTVERASEIVAAVRAGSGPTPAAVGVFVDAGHAEINRTIRDVGLNLVQLHGAEPPDIVAMLDAPAIKAIRPNPGASFDDVAPEIERYLASDVPPVAFHLEGYDSGHHGGGGTRADWAMAARLAVRFPIVLAGGLNPENVGDAVRSVSPLAVDVSSGVETDGIKDPAKISAFVATAKEQFTRQPVSG